VRVEEWERLLLVPVMATWTIDVEANVQERVELPEPVTLLGDTLHEVLLVLRLTTPVNPLSGVMVMLELPAEPTFTLILVGLLAIVKSWTLNATVTE